MTVSGLSGSMMRAFAEHTVESRKDTQTLIDAQDDRAVRAARQEVFLKDRANQERMKKQLYETVKAGVKTAQAASKVGDVAAKSAEQGEVKSNLQDAVNSGDLEQVKAVRIDERHTVGDTMSDRELQTLLEAPTEVGEAPTVDQQVARVRGAADPVQADLREAIDSGDFERLRDTPISEHSRLGDTMSDARIREHLAATGEGGAPLSTPERAAGLARDAQRREVTPETVRDKLLGELDRVASDVLGAREADDREAAAALAKNGGNIGARRRELYAERANTQQDLSRLGQLAADAHQPLFG